MNATAGQSGGKSPEYTKKFLAIGTENVVYSSITDDFRGLGLLLARTCVAVLLVALVLGGSISENRMRIAQNRKLCVTASRNALQFQTGPDVRGSRAVLKFFAT